MPFGWLIFRHLLKNTSADSNITRYAEGRNALYFKIKEDIALQGMQRDRIAGAENLAWALLNKRGGFSEGQAARIRCTQRQPGRIRLFPEQIRTLRSDSQCGRAAAQYASGRAGSL